MAEEVLRKLVERGDRDRQRQADQEQSIKATEYIGNGYVKQIGQAPTRSRYLGNAGLIPGELVAPLGHGQQDVIIHKKPAPFTIETIEEEPILIPSAYLVHLEQIDNTGFRAIYYRGSQKITLGDFRVFSNRLDYIKDADHYVAWIYDNSINHKWKQWVVWIRINERSPGYFGNRYIYFGVKGSSTTVIESRIYGRNIYVYYDREYDNDYSFATHNNPLSYALYDSLSYGTTVITPEDFLDTYDSDDPANYFRLYRLTWDWYNSYDSVRFGEIDENTIEVKSESTGRWIPFSNFNRTGNIIGGTTR